MNVEQTKGVFIVWREFQRRVEVLAPLFGLKIFYFHYSWEEKSKFWKMLSYIPKSIDTLRCLFQTRPSLVFIQLPPTPALYCAAAYSFLTGAKYVLDCHNSMVCEHWHKWIFVRELLSNGIMIVHNKHVAMDVERNMGMSPFVLRTGIANRTLEDDGTSTVLATLNLSPKCYAILPWNIASDEPLDEVLEAIELMPDTKFVMTWYLERLSNATRNTLPSNLILTGFLEIHDFNHLFSNAGVALILTTRDGTQLSGMHEAMAFGIPAVVSDLKTTRFLYKDGPIFVKNTPKAIVEGVRTAFEMGRDVKERMGKVRSETEREFSEQVLELKAMLSLDN